MERLITINQNEAAIVVQAMRILKMIDEELFNDIPEADKLMNLLTNFVIGKEVQV